MVAHVRELPNSNHPSLNIESGIVRRTPYLFIQLLACCLDYQREVVLIIQKINPTFVFKF